MRIITIGREFGSGGRELGKRIADILGCSYYDKEIVAAVSQEIDLNEAYIDRMLAKPFLIAGFNMLASAFFTALNNGFVSAAISFGRTLLFQTIAVFVLPCIFGIEGIWLAVSVAEILTLGVSVAFFVGNRKKYYYAKTPFEETET